MTRLMSVAMTTDAVTARRKPVALACLLGVVAVVAGGLR